MTMHGKIIQICAGNSGIICALTSTGKILKLDYQSSGKGTEWVDITPEVSMSENEQKLLNSLEEKE